MPSSSKAQKSCTGSPLALLRVAEPRLLACRDQQEILLTLQEEQANCLDCERLLSLAFDRVSFLRSFPRARVESLRRKPRPRKAPRGRRRRAAPHHRPATKPPPGTPPSAGSVASAPASSRAAVQQAALRRRQRC